MRTKASPNSQGNSCSYSQKWRKCYSRNSIGIRYNLTVHENTKILVTTRVHDVPVTLVHETNTGIVKAALGKHIRQKRGCKMGRGVMHCKQLEADWPSFANHVTWRIAGGSVSVFWWKNHHLLLRSCRQCRSSRSASHNGEYGVIGQILSS